MYCIRQLHKVLECMQYRVLYLFQTGQTFRLNPLPDKSVVSARGGHQTELAVYDVHKLGPDSMFNIALVHDKPRVFTQNIPPAIYANRYIIGK